MYSPLQGFQQSVPNVIVCVQTFRYHHYTLYIVGNIHDTFQGCTVDVQAATGF